MTEEWRAVPGFDGYEVSNLGNVRSWKVRGRHAKSESKKPRALTPSVSNSGYLRVGIKRNDGKCVTMSIHRMVAVSFVPGQLDGLLVCHQDSDRKNNVYTNLRWDTVSGNAVDCSRLGGIPRQVLNEDQVREIRDLYQSGGHTHRSLSEEFGVTHQAIRDLLIRKNYRWVA